MANTSETDAVSCELPEVLVETRSLLMKKKWVQDLLEESIATTKLGVLNWCNIVLQFGENDVSRDDWIEIFKNEHKKHMIEFVYDLEVLREKILDNIEELVQQCTQLCFDLGLPIEKDDFNNLPLYQVKKILAARRNKYDTEYTNRKEEISKLRKQEQNLCTLLGLNTKDVRESPLMTMDELNDYKNYVECLENEKYKREEQYYNLKVQISEIFNELNLKPSLDFERNLLNKTGPELNISKAYLDQVEAYYQTLKKKYQILVESIAELRKSVDDIWDKLDIDMVERDNFRKAHVGNSYEVQTALESELTRCSKLKRANMKGFIEKMRNELVELWEKCGCSDEQKHNFNSFFYSDIYNEDLLDLHENEVGKWRNYYEFNKDILQKLEEHKNLWNQLKEFELNTNGPNRFQNRGGQLLREEKERNRLKKKIPKVEEVLQTLANVYRRNHGKEFKFKNITIENYIANMYQELEKEKKLRLSAKKQEREHATTPAKSASRLFLSPMKSVTPKSKRKLLTPAMNSSIKKSRVTPKPNALLSTKKNTTKLTFVTNYKLNLSKRRQSAENKKRIEKKKRLSKSMASSTSNEACNATSSTAYEDFQREVTNRSSGVNEDKDLAQPLPKTPLRALENISETHF